MLIKPPPISQFPRTYTLAAGYFQPLEGNVTPFSLWSNKQVETVIE
jgi:hypothetical protein